MTRDEIMFIGFIKLVSANFTFLIASSVHTSALIIRVEEGEDKDGAKRMRFTSSSLQNSQHHIFYQRPKFFILQILGMIYQKMESNTIR